MWLEAKGYVLKASLGFEFCFFEGWIDEGNMTFRRSVKTQISFIRTYSLNIKLRQGYNKASLPVLVGLLKMQTYIIFI